VIGSSCSPTPAIATIFFFKKKKKRNKDTLEQPRTPGISEGDSNYGTLNAEEATELATPLDSVVGIAHTGSTQINVTLLLEYNLKANTGQKIAGTYGERKDVS
jgi:hypothetical protein